jgi:NAD(P)-dependent dehydrogenase (short-subunit alcohol dehydrogenase family)
VNEYPRPLDRKVALVTGASQGIGRAIAMRFARDGASVALVARTLESLNRVAAECNGETLVIARDVTDESSCTDVVKLCEERFGRIDCLVACAGGGQSQPFLRTDTELWRSTIALNVDAAFWLVRAALPSMLERGSGSVITIGSTASQEGAAYISAYVAAKHALLGLTRSLAAEFVTSGVTFNCVCPAYAATPMTDATLANIVAKTGRTPEEALAAILPPSGRLVEPEEVAAVCGLLASGLSPSLNGQAIILDGGPG